MIWDVTLCCLHGRYQCFKWTCCFLLQGKSRKEQLPLKTTLRSVISQKALNLRYRVMCRVSIKSFPDYKYLLEENYCMWNTNIFFFFQNVTQEVFLQHISTLQHVFLLLHGERLIDSVSPLVLQNVFCYCCKSICYSCLQICNIWNLCQKHFVLNIPP